MTEDKGVMSIQVDSTRCTGCKQCEKVCPNDCFMVENGIARIIQQNCLECGHCLAACPVSAITVQGLDLAFDFQTFTELEGVTVVQEDDLAQLVRLMRSRRSVRNYTEQPVALPVLQDLVKIGTTAPSGTNSQLWTFTILEQRADVVALGDGVARFFKKLNKKAASPMLRGLARVFAGDSLGRYYRSHYKTIQRGLDAWFEKGEDHLFHGAQAVILVGGRREASCPAEDALLATGQILLAAQQMGLGTCLIGFVVEALKHEPSLRDMIHLDADEDIYAVIALGYPDELYRQPAPRKKVQPRIVRLG
jgi:nitroreductase/NAD-dependent dihydropyrimidine dehydrogenase PreA subunit